jgi:hypothetical protein
LPTTGVHSRVPILSTMLYTNSEAWLVQLFSDGEIVTCQRQLALEFMTCRESTEAHSAKKLGLTCKSAVLVPIDQRFPDQWELQPFIISYFTKYTPPSRRDSF